MVARDLEARSSRQPTAPIDEENTRQMKSMVKQFGWIHISEYGVQAQRCDRPWQSCCAPPIRLLAACLNWAPVPDYWRKQSCAFARSNNYTLFDFSTPMLDMSRARLAGYPAATFVCGDFKLPDWNKAFLTPFDAVVSMQAAHEIRHKCHVPGLYRQFGSLLRPGGLLIVCDHTPPEDRPHVTALHSTEAEQRAALALAAAGFVQVGTALVLKGLYVCTGLRP